jgi:hypothetical protein
LYLTFLWNGTPAGKDFNPEEFDSGFLRGYLLERVYYAILQAIFQASSDFPPGHEAHFHIAILGKR